MFQSKVGGYLEEFLDRLQLLPLNVKRVLELVGDLDGDYEARRSELKELHKAYVAKAQRRINSRAGRGGNLAELAEDVPALEEIKTKQSLAVQHADERVNLMKSLESMIMYHMSVLDAKLVVFEDSLRASGNFVDQPPPKEPAPSTSKRGSKAHATAQRAHHVVPQEPVAVVEEPAPGPDEEVYCYCQRVYFGDMIGCDNDDCPIEWFHFECVGLTEQPKGTWYCPDCRATMESNNKRRKR